MGPILDDSRLRKEILASLLRVAPSVVRQKCSPRCSVVIARRLNRDEVLSGWSKTAISVYQSFSCRQQRAE